MKKSQIQSQLFIYILSIIIIGLLLYFGIHWIGELIKSEDIIDSTRFRIDLENSFDSIRPQYGSADNFEYSVPDGVDMVCFVDNTKDRTFISTTDLCDQAHEDYSALICNSWKDNISSVLFSPPLEDINIGNLDMESPFICFKTSMKRKIGLRLVGLGDKVRISRIN